MILASILLGGISFLMLLLAAYFWWARHRITNHPHVEPIHIAHPSIADEIASMVEHIATIICVPAPAVLVFRSELPNAFIVPAMRNPRLFLADELFEECNALGPDEGLKKLELTVCHELAHLKRRDALPLGLIELIAIIGQALRLNSLIQLSTKWHNQVELQTHNLASQFHKVLQQNLEGGAK